jgi:hypothetical protein
MITEARQFLFACEDRMGIVAAILVSLVEQGWVLPNGGRTVVFR